MDVKKTITTIFMVPTLRINKDYLKEGGFINGYVLDDRRDVQYENCVYMVFKPEDLESFKEFLENEYDRAKNIVDDYDYEDGFVVVVYQLSENFKHDFDIIKQGKYSKTSRAFQEIFPRIKKMKQKNGAIKDELSLQYRVFNKTEDLKQYWENKIDVLLDENLEFWTGFDIENETLNLDKLKEHV